nr:MAG TPA: hypothetical protein [Caudoviricetes sp.]
MLQGLFLLTLLVTESLTRIPYETYITPFWLFLQA